MNRKFTTIMKQNQFNSVETVKQNNLGVGGWAAVPPGPPYGAQGIGRNLSAIISGWSSSSAEKQVIRRRVG